MVEAGPKVLNDPTELRALAHPLRLRLLQELQANGGGNATLLAGRLGEPVNSVSFHLRQLAKYGFLEPVPDQAPDGRHRWWRLAHDGGIVWEGLTESAEGSRTVVAHLQSDLDRNLAAIRRFFSEAVEGIPKWQRGPFAHDWYLRLTPAELEEFDREYLDLCRKWSDQTRSRSTEVVDDEDERLTIGIYAYGFPLQDPGTGRIDPPAERPA